MSRLFNVSSSPHVRGGESTRSIMYDVAIALVPAAAFGVYRFGLYALAILALSIASAILTELAFQKLAKRPVTISDGSALVTGLLLGMNLPPTVPLWMPVLGSVFAILVVKQFFGGLGQNFMNPALGARCFLLISFTGLMNGFTLDGVSSATPLAMMKGGNGVGLAEAFLGMHAGVIGELSALAILLGAAYLLIKRVIGWEIPVCYVVVYVLFEGLFGGHGFEPIYLLTQVCSGGLLLGAFFMATDYATSPITKKGQFVYGCVLGILTGVLRVFGVAAEGVSYAIIISNLLVPLIERITMPRAYGYKPGSLQGKQTVKLSTYRAAFLLCGITVVAGLALGITYQVTKAPIEAAEKAAQAQAYISVCPDAASFNESEALTGAAETAGDFGGKYGAVSFGELYEGVDASGETVGYVVCVTSKEGFGGEIAIALGYDKAGTVTGIEFLTLNETAGLGMNADKPEFKGQFVGKTSDGVKLVKGGASAEDEIDAISGATITSTAVTNAVNAASELIRTATGEKGGQGA